MEVELGESNQPMLNAKTMLLNDYESLLNSGEYSDFTIVVGGKQFQVHKAILGAHSPVFAAMFKNETKEMVEKRAELPDISVRSEEHTLNSSH